MKKQLEFVKKIDDEYETFKKQKTKGVLEKANNVFIRMKECIKKVILYQKKCVIEPCVDFLEGQGLDDQITASLGDGWRNAFEIDIDSDELRNLMMTLVKKLCETPELKGAWIDYQDALES